MSTYKVKIEKEECETTNETCCMCINVHTGTLIIAILSILCIGLDLFYSFSDISLPSDLPIRILQWVRLVFELLGLFVAALLIYGNLKKSYQCYTPYLVYTGAINIIIVLWTVVSFSLFWISLFITLDPHFKEHGFEQLLAFSASLVLLVVSATLLILNGLGIYIWNVVKRSKELLKESSNFVVV